MTYLDVTLFEGVYHYLNTKHNIDLKLVPSWGGSMFEALMVPLLVPEERWGPHSWGLNHLRYAQAHIQHGLQEAQYQYWGFSPTSDPDGNYRAYGVDAIGMQADGYASNNDNTLVDYGFSGCPGRRPQPLLPPPSQYTNGIVAPHASFLALHLFPEEAFTNLNNLRQGFNGLYNPEWGFWSSVNVETHAVSHTILALDQGMVMAALGNFLTDNRLQRYFTQGAVETVIKPLLAIEAFTAIQ